MKTKLLAAFALAAVLGIALAGPALAHVTVHEVSPGHDGFVTIAFRVPNESDTGATTTKLEVTFPDTPAITSASTQPVDGWKAGVSRLGARVVAITWTGGVIAPGQFQEFPISIGGIPDGTGSITFKAVQTYDSGDVVRWIEEATPGGDEPEHPAPVLELTAVASHDDHATPAADGGGQPVAAYGIAVAALALSVVSFVRSGRRAS